MRSLARCATVLLIGTIGALSACSSTDSNASDRSSNTSTAPPTASATPSPLDLKGVLITATDLDGSWKRESVAKDRSAGECHPAGLPGGINANQIAWGNFKETEGNHKAVMALGLMDLDSADISAYSKATAKESDDCTGKSSYGWYVVSSGDDAPTVDGAEVLTSYRQRMYVDKKRTQFLFVRQGLVLDKNGTVIHIENAFVPKSTKDKGQSFEPTLAIAHAQLARLT